jgi:hypothetical protein
MALSVADRSANTEEMIAQAAKVLGRSKHRRKVFDAIYTGKQRVKGVVEIAKSTGLTEKRVLEEGKKLVDNEIVIPVKSEGRMAYEKIDFYHHHKKKIIRLASYPAELKKYSTKRNPSPNSSAHGQINLTLNIPRKKQNARLITIDDIDSFAKVRRIGNDFEYTKMPESNFKKGIAKILGERGNFKDWGGENRDLASTRVKIRGKRHSTAFAFKGPGKTGKLTPAKMGKNGDQIQRLFRCPADVFLVQYWAEIEDSVLEQIEHFAQLKSFLDERVIWYGVIDGVDSSRIINAYPEAFQK